MKITFAETIAEILSPGIAKRDRTVKKDIYEQFGVKEYWLVDPNYKTIEVYTLKDNHYALHTFAEGEEKVTSALLPNLEMGLHFISSE